MKKLIPYSQLKTKPTKLSHFFKTERRWCKIWNWKDADSYPIQDREKITEVCSVCLLGALYYLGNQDPDKYKNTPEVTKLAQIIKKHFPEKDYTDADSEDLETVYMFNDNATFEDIQKIAKLYDETTDN